MMPAPRRTASLAPAKRRMGPSSASNSLPPTERATPDGPGDGSVPQDVFLHRAGELLHHRARGGAPFAVLCVSLDHLDAVSDGLGPLATDALRVAAAGRIAAVLRPDATVARLGGGEIVVLLEGVRDAAAAVRTVDALQGEIARPFLAGGHEIFTTASVGVALATAGYGTAEGLVRDAHAAMGQARARGRGNCRLFYPSMHAAAVELLQLEAALRHGLERDEFVLHYQPIVSLEDGRITAFEALVRWRHPERGLLLPGAFLAAAEDSGLIVPLGRWALREACRQMQAWRQAHPAAADVAVNVNLSTRQFLHAGLVEEVEEALRESGLPGNALRLEITESAIMERGEACVELLCTLKALGVQLCIDDFGTGYSSLSYLHRFPVDVLKIDRSFMRDLGVHGENLGIVRAIVALAHGLGMHAVPEGVETAEHLACVRELECAFGQGYLFSPAVDADRAGELLRTDRHW
ncbi:MAG TPA: bifunctional diguanylate cyclase/phosphodiesterase [Longimicrobium sp.]|nr:bifunctional diguanylate cyclase/phosphodiesterase [Longimicrobium sp.]